MDNYVTGGTRYAKRYGKPPTQNEDPTAKWPQVPAVGVGPLLLCLRVRPEGEDETKEAHGHGGGDRQCREDLHTLFMGAEHCREPRRGDLYPVRDVASRRLMGAEMIGGEEKLLSTKDSSTNLKVTPDLKLSEGSHDRGLQRRMRAYSFANDPNVIITKRLTKTGMDTAMQSAPPRPSYADAVSSLGGAHWVAAEDSTSNSGTLRSKSG